MAGAAVPQQGVKQVVIAAARRHQQRLGLEQHHWEDNKQLRKHQVEGRRSCGSVVLQVQAQQVKEAIAGAARSNEEHTCWEFDSGHCLFGISVLT
jgi:hypothetical protein